MCRRFFTGAPPISTSIRCADNFYPTEHSAGLSIHHKTRRMLAIANDPSPLTCNGNLSGGKITGEK
jgi:hypothetical protein